MARLAIVLLSDMNDPVKVEMAMRFALVARREERLEDIRFFFFGPGVRVPAQVRDHETLQPLLGELLDSGIATLACIYNARQLGQEEQLKAREIQMQAIGPDLVNALAADYQVMTF